MPAITITNAGLNLMRDGLAGANNSLIKYVALGTSITAPVAGDVKLGAEVFRKAVTSYTNGATPGEILINLYLASGDAVGKDIEEVGFFGGNNATSVANTGILLAHGLYAHNPKLNTESITFTLDFTA
jgi:hypothetical protein